MALVGGIPKQRMTMTRMETEEAVDTAREATRERPGQPPQ
jgi:hypothetical protein